MAMEAPQNYLEIEAFQAQQKLNKRRYLVGLVDPQGTVREMYLRPDKDPANSRERGIEVARLLEGENRLTAYGKRVGWSFLEIRCKEDGCPEKYLAWKETVFARMDGHPIQFPKIGKGSKAQFDMSSVYPPSVIEQRSSGGRAAGGGRKTFVPGKGFVDGDDDDAARIERYREMAGVLGLEPEEASS